MAKQKPDDAKMKIGHGVLPGFYMGSGDRAVAIERLRRWVEHAAEHLSTEMIDQIAVRIEMYLAMEARYRGEKERAHEWYDRFHAELVEDKRAHRQVQ